jgi:hypothetical protein
LFKCCENDEKLSADKYFQAYIFFKAKNMPQIVMGEKIINSSSYLCQHSQMIPQDRKISKHLELFFAKLQNREN